MQEKIIEAFKDGSIFQQTEGRPAYIRTAISHVFVFEKTVFKIYRTDNDSFNKHFNNLAEGETRFQFTTNDFEWNRKLSPEIYTSLKGISFIGNQIVLGEVSKNAEELVIVMNRFDENDRLVHKLIKDEISIEDCYQIGLQLAKRESAIWQTFPTINLYQDFKSRYVDLTQWVQSQVTPKESAFYLSYTKQFIEEHAEEFNSSSGLVGACMDVHADNALFVDGIFQPIDTYAPKANWLHGYLFLNIYRVATDIFAFKGKEGFEATLQGYAKATGRALPRNFDTFLIAYCALIMWPYQLMLSGSDEWRKESAEKYRALLESLLQ